MAGKGLSYRQDAIAAPAVFRDFSCLLSGFSSTGREGIGLDTETDSVTSVHGSFCPYIVQMSGLDGLISFWAQQ